MKLRYIKKIEFEQMFFFSLYEGVKIEIVCGSEFEKLQFMLSLSSRCHSQYADQPY